jgi:hypothetical protein
MEIHSRRVAWTRSEAFCVEEQLGQVRRLLKNPAMPGVANQIDLLAQAIMAASYFGTGEDPGPESVRHLSATEAW